MACQEHLEILARGVTVWNQWREEHIEIQPDLSGSDLCQAEMNSANLYRTLLGGTKLIKANLTGASLRMADLADADLTGAILKGADLWMAHLPRAKLNEADLTEANLCKASLREADLTDAILYKVDLEYADISKATIIESFLAGANLINANFAKSKLYKTDLSQANAYKANFTQADLREVNLSNGNMSKAGLCEANLRGADLSYANLFQTNLTKADLHGAKLVGAQLVETDLRGANLKGCSIYGISAWRLNMDASCQLDLIVTPHDEPAVTVDNLEVAQFIYLLLHNQKIRDVIDTITSKVVLILGRFTPERKVILDALRNELRKFNFTPVLFDFERPSSRNLTETVSTLAHLVKFVIADITDAKSIPQELQRIVPQLPSVPIQPLIEASQYEYAMFKDFFDYHWVLTPYQYSDVYKLLSVLPDMVIAPALLKSKEIEERRYLFEQDLAKKQC